MRFSSSFPPGMIDDQGLADAVARMHKSERFFSHGELKNLQRDLRPDERVVMLASCAIDGSVGLLMLTTKRLIAKDKTLGTSSSREIDPRQVTSITTGRSMGNESMDLTVSGSVIKVANLIAGRAEELARSIRQVAAQAAQPQQPMPVQQAPVAPAEPDVMQQLQQLGQLRDSGVLTDDEFAAKKAELLARL